MQGEEAAACSIVWYEFLCGPVEHEHVELALAVMGGRVMPIEESHAQRAAILFNAVSRPRRLRTNCLIAAFAIDAGAQLATLNRKDFDLFVPHGLQLC